MPVVPNGYHQPTFGEWLFADIPVAYDPCTCEEGASGPGSSAPLTENLSELLVKGQLVDVQVFTVDENGQQSSNPVPNVSTAGVGGVPILNGIDETDIKEGVEFFTSASKLRNDLASKEYATVETEVFYGGMPGYASIVPTGTSANWPEILLGIGKTLEFGVENDFLFGGGVVNQSTISTSQSSSGSQGKSYTGALEWKGETMTGAHFYTPGTNYETHTIVDEFKKPIYDHVLGVFNLLETPVIEYGSYEIDPSVDRDRYGCIDGHDNEVPAFFPRIYQYRIKDPLKYVVNPASELEVVSIQASIVYEVGAPDGGVTLDQSQRVSEYIGTYNSYLVNMNRVLGFYGPVVTGYPLGLAYDDLNYGKRLAESGISLDIWPKQDPIDVNSPGVDDLSKMTFSTGMLPLGCLQQQSLFLAIPPEEDPDSNPPNPFSNLQNFTDYHFDPSFRMKLRVVFRRTDQDAMGRETEYVVFVGTYAVEMEDSEITGTYKPSFISPNNTPDCPDAPIYMKDYIIQEFLGPNNEPIFPLGGNGYPIDLVFDNTTLQGSRTALSTITFNGSEVNSGTVIYTPPYPGAQPITQPGPAITLLAGTEIDLNPGSMVDPSVNLEIGLPFERFGACEQALPQSPESWTSVQKDFCENKSIYRPYFQTLNRERITTEERDWEMEVFPLTAHPNPFTESVTLRYTLPEQAEATLVLYDALGRPVRTLLSGELTKAGPHELLVPAADLAAGLYHAVLQAGEARASVKVVKQ